MDWKLDKLKKERNIAFARREAANNINLLEEMDKEFERIFGKESNPLNSSIRGKAGDPVKRSEISARISSVKRD